MSSRIMVLVPLALLFAGAAPGGEPAGDRTVRAAVLAAAARDEAAKASPALAEKLDWKRVQVTLEEAGSVPDAALARATVLAMAGQLRDWPAAEQAALLRLYVRDDKPAVRCLAIELMSRPEAVKAGTLADLRSAAEKDPDPAVRVRAAEELLRNGDPAGWKPLLEALYSDDPKTQAEGAVQATPHREAKEALIELSLEHWKFGANAARLPKALKLVKRAWVMKDNVIRRTIAEMVGLNRDPAHLAMLLDWEKQEEAWTALRSLYIGMGYLGDKAAVPTLREALTKPKAKRAGRLSPAMGLVLVGDRSGLDALVEGLSDAENFPTVARALSRAFEPDFPADSENFLVPDAAGKLQPAWIPAASAGMAPMIDDGKGGKVRAEALGTAQVQAAWKSFLEKSGQQLSWDPAACRYSVGGAGR